MIVFNFPTPRGSFTCTFYHDYDIDINDVVSWKDVGNEHVGQYLKFDNGSNLYTQIISATREVVFTSSGVYRRSDIVHMSIPNNKDWTTSGLHHRELHPAVLPYTHREKQIAHKIITGQDISGDVITRRIRMLTSEKIHDSLEAMDVTEELIAQTLVGSIDPESKFWARGKNYEFAITQILRFNGIDIKKELESGNDQISLTKLMAPAGTAILSEPNDNKVPTLRDIKNLLKIKTKQEMTRIDEAEYTDD